MKKYFITGLLILLPLAVTIAVLVFVFNFLTEPFAGAVAKLLDYYDLLEHDFFFATGHQIQFFISQLLILAFFIVFTTILGLVARYFLVNYFIGLWDYLLHKIPLIRTIYKIAQDIIQTLFSGKANAFKQVVLAPFPHKDVYSIGFITQEGLKDFTKEEMVAVFVPTTPNPTSGFLVLYPQNELIYLDMKVDQAFKYVISCGVIPTPFTAQNNNSL